MVKVIKGCSFTTAFSFCTTDKDGVFYQRTDWHACHSLNIGESWWVDGIPPY